MLRIIVRRLISLPFVILSITFITFIAGYLAPGDPILALMGNQRDEVIYEQLRETYGLNAPWYEQYIDYVTGLAQGDLGLSYRFAERPVWDLIGDSIGISFSLGLVALTLSITVGIPVGTMAALRQNSTVDRFGMTFMLAFYAIPSFVLIPVLQWINYQVFLFTDGTALPAAGWGRLEHWIMPVIALSATSMGYIARLTRSSVLEISRQEFVRTANAKGLTLRRIHWAHIFRNAMLPIVTVIGPSIAFLVTGAFIVENLFSIPGIGFLSINAIEQRDYPVIQGTTVFLALAVVIMNLITDITYVLLDPRVQLER